MRVGQHFDVEVQLDQSVETVTVSDNGLLGSNVVFVVGLYVHGEGALVVGGDCVSRLSVLEDLLRLAVHEGHDKARLAIAGVYLVRQGALSTVVVDVSELVTLVGARAGDPHGIQEGEATGVPGGVGEEVRLGGSLLDLVVFSPETVDTLGSNVGGTSLGKLLLGIRDGDSLLVEAVGSQVFVFVERVLVDVGVVVGVGDILLKSLQSSRETVR